VERLTEQRYPIRRYSGRKADSGSILHCGADTLIHGDIRTLQTRFTGYDEARAASVIRYRPPVRTRPLLRQIRAGSGAPVFIFYP